MILSKKILHETQERFVQEGISVSEWAKAHGFPVGSVYAVLNGRSRARRGQSHQIAVALGLKTRPANNYLFPCDPVISKEQPK